MAVVYMKLTDDLDQQLTEMALDQKIKKNELIRDLIQAGITYRATKEDLALVEKERDVLKERVKDLQKLAAETFDAAAKPVVESIEKSRVFSCPDGDCEFTTTNPAEYLEHRLPTIVSVAGDEISKKLEQNLDAKLDEKISDEECARRFSDRLFRHWKQVMDRPPGDPEKEELVDAINQLITCKKEPRKEAEQAKRASLPRPSWLR